MRHFLSLLDYSSQALTAVLDRADGLRLLWQQGQMPQSLQHKQVGLWFLGQGFRNRLAFEIGAKAMGAVVSYIPGELGIHEPLEDVGHYLRNWYSLLVVRAKNHADLRFLAESAGIPVINARTDFSHPCEVMGDLQFIRQRRGTLDGLKVVFMGELTNLCMSWCEAAARFPIEVTQIAPEGYLAPSELLTTLNAGAVGRIDVGTNLDAALENANLIYTDCWHKTSDPAEAQMIRRLFLPYQISTAHLARLGEDGLFLPCPPVTRGQEVSDEAMQSPLCLNYEAKDYLLHAQNAILEMVIG